jgi:hypothetical protein
MSIIRRYPLWFRDKWKTKHNCIPYRNIIEQYFHLYLEQSDGGKIYGRSSEDLLDKIAPIIFELNPSSILDYGCGRSALVNHFWNEGKRKLYKYDPAIHEYRFLPKEDVELVICTDVLEHIPEDYLPVLISDIMKFSDKVIFTVSLKLA